jgi:hypothetical protein
MEDHIAAAKTLLIVRARELAHLYALEHEFTGLINETTRKVEGIQRLPQRDGQAVKFARMREAVQAEARIIEQRELMTTRTSPEKSSKSSAERSCGPFRACARWLAI